MRACTIIALLIGLACEASTGESMEPMEPSTPDLVLLSPNGGEVGLGSPISFRLSGNEDPARSLSVELLRLDASGTVATTELVADNLASAGGVETESVPWDWQETAQADFRSEPLSYKVRVNLHGEEGIVASDESDQSFTLGSELDVPLTWDVVKPIFVTYCVECHSQPAFTGRVEYFRLDKYDAADEEPPLNADLGVVELRPKIEDRMLMQGNMPPFGFAIPSDREKAIVANWFGEGAGFE